MMDITQPLIPIWTTTTLWCYSCSEWCVARNRPTNILNTEYATQFFSMYNNIVKCDSCETELIRLNNIEAGSCEFMNCPCQTARITGTDENLGLDMVDRDNSHMRVNCADCDYTLAKWFNGVR